AAADGGGAAARRRAAALRAGRGPAVPAGQAARGRERARGVRARRQGHGRLRGARLPGDRLPGHSTRAAARRRPARAGGARLMATRVVTVDRNQKAGVLPILRGLQITLVNLLRSLFLRQVSTVSYPEQKRPVSSRYRGIHILTEREDGTP